MKIKNKNKGIQEGPLIPHLNRGFIEAYIGIFIFLFLLLLILLHQQDNYENIYDFIFRIFVDCKFYKKINIYFN